MSNLVESLVESSVETIRCRGHENVLSRHKSTFEVTKEPHLSKSGDCIIAVSSDKGAADLNPKFKALLMHDEAELTTTLKINDLSFVIHSMGSSQMTLTHETDLVWRKSNFVCPRTVGIYSDASACMLPDEIVSILKSGAEMIVELRVEFNPKVQSPSVQPLAEFFHNCEG